MRNQYRWSLYTLYALAAGFSIALVAAPAQSAGGKQCNSQRPDTAAAALKALLEGNARWAAGASQHPGEDSSRRTCVSDEGQTPFATILSCSDSRVPPELVFDQGVGDLFVVRTAGNNSEELEHQSIEYSSEMLGAPLIFVLGHQKCGAVKGAADLYPTKGPLFLSLIYSAIAKSKEIIRARGGDPNDKSALAKEAIDQHVIMEVKRLRKTAAFKEQVDSGRLRIVGGRYDLDTGRVTMLIQ